MDGFIEYLVTMIASGVVTGLVTWGAVKNDILWIKNLITSHDERIKFLERKN